MLKDANSGAFTGIYLVCGFTDLRYGIDSLAAITKKRYKKGACLSMTLSKHLIHMHFDECSNLSD